jgi:hypothetical protein
MKLPTRIILLTVLLLVGRFAFGQQNGKIAITITGQIKFGELGGTDKIIYIKEYSEKNKLKIYARNNDFMTKTKSATITDCALAF